MPDGFIGSKIAWQNCTAVLDERLDDVASSSSAHPYNALLHGGVYLRHAFSPSAQGWRTNRFAIASRFWT
ncbi:hypothetical protein N7537_004719 [Penicillium hordei]|uniref:Uncharacterized protein n=1 Tax=Penicillium hordei TaxID=40994 RepID=A0AAD6H6D1_9EURO|nr:uncharacterized protein N7537_004719 [Penicillium hordei]KAJ5608100.1 hypothetical protein N7537_004719 [Penicillium hordei]